MAKTVTFLQLSAEFGGTRFGPFQGVEIRLGSDPSRNDITLPETLGVAPEHVKVLKQTDGSFILTPVDRAAAVYFWRAGSTRPKQLQAPMAVKRGDAFSLVTTEGPRFEIMVEINRAAIEAAAKESEGPGMNLPRMNVNAGGIRNELRRVGFAKFFATKFGNYIQNGWRLIKTGQIFSPLYIVMGMTMLSGWVMAGGASCTALSFNKSRSSTQQELTDCQDSLTGLGMRDGDGDPTVYSLTRNLLGDPSWGPTIDNDRDLYQAYATHLRMVFADADRYKWVYAQAGSDFERFKTALERAGLTPPLVRVMAYSAAHPGFGAAREWGMVLNSDDEEVCGRGPLNLTYAQGYRLGLQNLQLDAFVDRTLAASNDLEKKVEALTRTASRIDAPTEFDQDLIRGAGANLQGGAECLYVVGDDDRTDVNALADAIQRRLGANVTAHLPRDSETYWIAARLVKLFSYDFRLPAPENLSFDARQAPTTAMRLQEVRPSRQNYAVNQTAAAMARAVAIPCLAALDKETRKSPPRFLGELPNLASCAIIKAFVEYDQI